MTRRPAAFVLPCLALFVLLAPAQAQETAIGAPAGSSAEQDPTTEAAPTSSIIADLPAVTVPAACEAAAVASGVEPPAAEAVPEGMPAHGQAMLEGLLRLRQPLIGAMTAEDPDLAFACAMIAHHQAAINIADIGLATGEAEDLKGTARAIIDQHREQVEALTRWVVENAP